jgi:predicted transcriptional regulator
MIVSTTFRVEREQLDRLQQEARRRDVGWTQLAQAAVREWLDRHEGKDPLA